MLAYAASGFLKERFFECSDKYIFYVCSECGTISVANPSKKIFSCTHCRESTDFRKIRAPYSFKLLLQELMGMGHFIKNVHISFFINSIIFYNIKVNIYNIKIVCNC